MNIFGRNISFVGLLVVLAFAFGMATYHFAESPLTAYDEGILIQMAGNLFHTGSLALRVTPDQFSSGAYMTTGYPALLPIATFFQFFGVSVFNARIVMVVFLLGFLTAFYVVANRLYGKRAAFLSTALMATHASIYAYGKPVLGEIPGLFYLMLFLWGLDTLTRQPKHSLRWVIFTSLMLGLAAVTKPIFLLVLPAAALTLLIARKRLSVTISTCAAAVITLIVCATGWLATQFFRNDDWSKVLLFYRNPYFIQNVGETILINLKHMFTEATPLYVVGLLFVWLVSIVWRLWTKRASFSEAPAQFSVVETFGFLFVGLVLTAYLRTPGFYRYFFLANSVLLLVFPGVLQDVLRRVWERFPGWRADVVARDLATVLCAGLILFQGYRLFHGSFITTTYTSTQTAELTRYFTHDFDKNRQPYLYDVPEIAPFLPTQRYSQWIEVSGGGVFALGVPLSEELIAKPDTIIIHEKRWGQEKALFPGYHQVAYVVRYVVLERDK